jgi:DNA-binding transcriptional ArsR family regulator
LYGRPVPDDGIRVRTGLSSKQMRALAHPLRLRMLEVLREAPATASALGRRLGESSGATSYHLRALATAGLVEEEERGSKRERWWRRLDSFTVIQRTVPGDATPAEAAEIRAALAQIDAFFLDRDDEALRRWTRDRDLLGPEWQDASMLGNWTIQATPAEVNALWTVVLREIDKLRRSVDDAPAGAAPVHVSLRVLPTPEA